MRETSALSTSLRTRRLDETLRLARELAPALGITRVTDITRLDYVGVPVYASIRPRALPGSLCVNAGKGLDPAEAQVGAYMEAIEFAFAEPNRAGLDVFSRRAGDVYDGAQRPHAVLDFCPLMHAEIDLGLGLPCVEATDIVSGETFAVPAELVFLPFDAPPGLSFFGSTSNGLASGNTVGEATLHGLTEVIERDITSFESLDDRSALVALESLPPALAAIARAIDGRGMALYVRYAANQIGIPYFAATVAELDLEDPVYVNGGFGCHPVRDIAIARAVSEALQSRLSFIHGGRDDLVDVHDRFAPWAREARIAHARRIVALAASRERVIHLEDVPDLVAPDAGIDATLGALVERLKAAGIPRVLRVTYTPRDFPLAVVRVIVPRLEFFTPNTPRVGFRLRDHVAAL